MIFDGREFAVLEIKRLRDEVIKITNKLGRRPTLATIYNPTDMASRVYTEIKAKKAEELGIEFLKFQVSNPNDQINLKNQIETLNNDSSIDGLMIQTPLVDRETDRALCELIDPKKDADGLNPKSGVVPATVKAVLKILSTSPLAPLLSLGEGNKKGEVKIVVVGQRGLVGSEILKRINGSIGLSADGLDVNLLREADVIISATGREGLIKQEMIKDGAICIDVGYPKGDFDPSVSLRTGFFTPVPGGVGPVTVVCLFENLLELLSQRVV